MNHKKAQEIALKRYGFLAPLISGTLDSSKSKAQFFREVAIQADVHPYTVERWYRAYQSNGFDGLCPKNRSDIQKFRKLDSDITNEIDYLLDTFPRISATLIYQKLVSNGKILMNEVSLSTINRYVQKIKKEKGTVPIKDLRRYECEHINDVWCGDTSVGPYIKIDGKKCKTYIIALIDDASRMITGIDIFLNDNFVNLLGVLKGAVSKYGKPKKLNFDNGANYRSQQMNLLAARIGVVLHYDPVKTPTSKAKIERWFRTMKDQWMATLHYDEFHSLKELQQSLFKYVQEYNQTVHSSLQGKSPCSRFFDESEVIIRMSDKQIEQSFLLEIERTVSNDNVVRIDDKDYEVNYRYAGQRLLLRYSPDLSQIYVVDKESRELEPIKLLDKHKNATMHRTKVKLTELEEG